MNTRTMVLRSGRTNRPVWLIAAVVLLSLVGTVFPDEATEIATENVASHATEEKEAFLVGEDGSNRIRDEESTHTIPALGKEKNVESTVEKNRSEETNEPIDDNTHLLTDYPGQTEEVKTDHETTQEEVDHSTPEEAAELDTEKESDGVERGESEADCVVNISDARPDTTQLLIQENPEEGVTELLEGNNQNSNNSVEDKDIPSDGYEEGDAEVVGEDGHDGSVPSLKGDPSIRNPINQATDTSLQITTIPDEDEEDERTLLDVFGELSKEFLTQRVIPDTDEECHWDWRSLRCEPACECFFDGKWGDYHLGRSCRLLHLHGKDEEGDNQCVAVDPAIVLREAPVPKRVISLVSQTIDILYTELHRVFQRFRNRIIQTWEGFQERMCRETWDLAERLVGQHKKLMAHKSPSSNVTCIPASMVLTLHTTRSFWERTLCGPPQEYPICESMTSSPPPQPSYHYQGHPPPHL